MIRPLDRLLSVTRDAVRDTAGIEAASDCPETAIPDEFPSWPATPSTPAVQPAQTPVAADCLDAAARAATTTGGQARWPAP